MKHTQAARRFAGVALIALVGLVGLGADWLAGRDGPAAPQPDSAMGRAAAASGSAMVDTLSAGIAPPKPAASTADRDAFLNAGLKFRLEDLLLEAGEADSPIALKQRIGALAPRHFAAHEVTRAIELLERHVDYRVALGDIKPPKDAGDPRALRNVMEARHRVREKHFGADEREALFAQEDELDRFTLARLEIERNAGLTAAQKAMAIREAEDALSESHRAARTEAVAHVAVAAQSAAFEAAGLDERARHAQRRAQYGEAVATQLAQLDRDERDWQARLDTYAREQAGNPPAGQLEHLRQQLFSPQEQLRIDAALALRQQQAKTTLRP